MIAADKGRGELLPRAAGVIPQLLNSLRDEAQSDGELAQRVARDSNLVAEVTRLANSTAFRRTEPVTELAGAVRHAAARSVKAAQGFAAAEDPLAQLLLAGNRVAALRVLVSAGRVHENPDQVAQWTPGVQAAYNALA